LSDTVYLNLTANVLTTNFKDNSLLEPIPEKLGKNDETFKDFNAVFRVIDAETRLPISGASITFLSSSPTYKNLETDKNGKAIRILHNRYDVSIYAFGYETVTVGISLGCNDSIRTVALVERDTNSKTEAEYMYEYEGSNPIIIKDTLADIDPFDEERLLEPLTEGNYKPNNIVFLMDISISMKDHERMGLLKSAIIQLVELLRPEDNVSIITFSEQTNILVVPTYLSNGNREDVIRLIKTLKPGGLTNGGRGLKMAYKLIRENYDAAKNNQIILATDGALGSYMKHEDMVKMIEKNTLYASTSVVTLNGYNWSGKFMREIVKAGKGKLLTINNKVEAKLMLIREIKTNSLIGSND
jgi:Mg-chelatase subunit ChlD